MSLGRLVVRRPILMVVAALLVTVLSGVYQADLTPRLSGGGFAPQTAESGLATRLLASNVRGGVPNLVLVTDYDNTVLVRLSGDEHAASVSALRLVRSGSGSSDGSCTPPARRRSTPKP